MSWRVDGASTTNTANSGTVAGTLNNANRVLVGDGTKNNWNGKIAEIVVYSGNIIGTDRQKIETYLALKYGITQDNTNGGIEADYLSSAGTTLWDASANSNYHNDVAGIGRDDSTYLDQRQSMSENADAILTIGNSTIAASNGANASSFSANNSFLIWGNDDEPIHSFKITDLPATIEARVARVWKAEETGTIGTVKLRFDLSGITGPDNDLNFVRLLVDADGVFGSGATIVNSSALNNTTKVIEFDHNFTVGTGFFFSIGSTDIDQAPLPIELVNFTAKESNGKVRVAWRTNSEINNDYFIVEQSNDGIE